jgi:hypothetical protein
MKHQPPVMLPPTPQRKERIDQRTNNIIVEARSYKNISTAYYKE